MKRFILALLCAFIAMASGAQNVTVRPSNGSMIAATPEGSSDYDTFFNRGGFATWQHNQLNLTVTTADYGTLTANGMLSNPANNIYGDTSVDALQIGKGAIEDCFVTFSLPKGYRFTQYRITFARDKTDFGTGSGKSKPYSDGTSIFGETDSQFAYSSVAGTQATAQYSTTTRHTINRTSMTDDDMGNILYFKLSGPDGHRAAITLYSVELIFTAEANYSPVTPASDIEGVSAVNIPFATSKVDYGSIENRTYNGLNRIAYSSANVTDLEAYLTLFEAESVKDGENFDGTQGKVVNFADGTISNENDFFKLGRTDQEQIYYIETPTYVTLSDGSTKNPIGYRITDASFDYSYGTAHAAGTKEVKVPVEKEYDVFYISATVALYSRSWTFLGYTYSYLGPTTYYLTAQAGMSTQESDRAYWFMDSEGYIRLTDDPSKYLKNQAVNNTNNRIAVVGLSDSPAKYAINNNGQITLKSNSNMYLSLSTEANQNRIYQVNYFQMINNGATKATRTNYGKKTLLEYETKTVATPAFTPQDFTLRVYDKTGREVIEEVSVTSTTPDGTITLHGLNNDAVKIGVKGVGLVKGTLTLQALDPYIDRLSIVCQEASGNGRKLSQPFNANDFAVSGGKFDFYVPEDYDLPAKFTFENLYSKYGDSTYYGKTESTNNARYSLVKSPYWTQNADLYAESYNPDAGYEDKIRAEVAGSTPFKFNNASQFSGTNPQGGIYKEYPFTLKNYGNGGGTFKEIMLGKNEFTTAYLFTCDETRYNISPATATQHRYYAFYQMDITLEQHNYSPEFSWEKVYDATCFNDGSVQEKSMWGVTPLTGKNAQGQYGYLTVSQIVDGIQKELGQSGRPESLDQLLYVDASQLLSVVENEVRNASTGETVKHGYDELRKGLAKNSVVYLPEGSNSDLDNFAYMTQSGSFQGANNFILADKLPFYAPYDIQVDAANYALYEREVTNAKNGKVTSATIVMPFQIRVNDNGEHVNNPGEEPAFSLHTMQGSNCLSDEAPEGTPQRDNVSWAFFPNIDVVKTTEPNKPYVVKVLKEDAGSSTSFVVRQTGTLIKATKGMNSDYTFSGEKASGTAKGTSYNFTNLGSYAGKKLQKGGGYFYFAQNKFVCSNDLNKEYDVVKVYPFRAFYSTGTTNARLMSDFEIFFGEGFGTEDPTGVSDLEGRSDLVVAPGRGSISMTAAESQTVRVSNVNGVTAATVSIPAGETRTVSVPAGIYVVNGVKIIVK